MDPKSPNQRAGCASAISVPEHFGVVPELQRRGNVPLNPTHNAAINTRKGYEMWIFGKYVEKRVLYPVAAFVLTLIVAMIALGAAVYTPSTISGATVYGFEGQRTMVEIATEDATITYKVQYRIATVWTDIEPDGSSPADVFTVFPGQSDRWSWTYMGAAADSTRLIVTPVAATDVTVRVQ